jgi:hypothetical protein
VKIGVSHQRWQGSCLPGPLGEVGVGRSACPGARAHTEARASGRGRGIRSGRDHELPVYDCAWDCTQHRAAERTQMRDGAFAAPTVGAGPHNRGMDGRPDRQALAAPVPVQPLPVTCQDYTVARSGYVARPAAWLSTAQTVIFGVRCAQRAFVRWPAREVSGRISPSPSGSGRCRRRRSAGSRRRPPPSRPGH